jgi:hypothetical protein
MIDALGASAASIEAQLRWEEYLASLSPEELEAMAARRQGRIND